MAHRALVAYERAPGRYDVHTARWGGLHCRLATAITPDDPFADGAVDPEPRVRDRRFESVVTMVDLASHEALYRVDATFAVDSYLPLWFGLDHYLSGPVDIDAEPPGLLVAVDTPEEARSLREWLRAAKATVAEAVVAGALDRAAAQDILARAARRRAGDRGLLDPTGVDERSG